MIRLRKCSHWMRIVVTWRLGNKKNFMSNMQIRTVCKILLWSTCKNCSMKMKFQNLKWKDSWNIWMNFCVHSVVYHCKPGCPLYHLWINLSLSVSSNCSVQMKKPCAMKLLRSSIQYYKTIGHPLQKKSMWWRRKRITKLVYTFVCV